MSFSLVYCSFCKSSLRIGSCQISSPKIHTGAPSAPRTHWSSAGSSGARNASEGAGARAPFCTLGWPCSSLDLFALELEKRDFYQLQAQLCSQSRALRALSSASSSGQHWGGLGGSGVSRWHRWDSPACSASWKLLLLLEKLSWTNPSGCEAAVGNGIQG